MACPSDIPFYHGIASTVLTRLESRVTARFSTNTIPKTSFVLGDGYRKKCPKALERGKIIGGDGNATAFDPSDGRKT